MHYEYHDLVVLGFRLPKRPEKKNIISAELLSH